jgi:hypothetical protein
MSVDLGLFHQDTLENKVGRQPNPQGESKPRLHNILDVVELGLAVAGIREVL